MMLAALIRDHYTTAQHRSTNPVAFENSLGETTSLGAVRLAVRMR